MKNTAAIILAAGKGSRINASTKNKVAYKIGGKPMISHTVSNLQESGVSQILVVIGFKGDSVCLALGDKLDYVTQTTPLGTGDAIKQALPHLKPTITTVLSVYGDDSAFYPPALYKRMSKTREIKDADILFLTIIKEDPTGLGRIIRDDNGAVKKIVEEKIASPKEKLIKEINTGFYCFKRSFLEKNIGKIKKNPVSQEYYATDLVEIAIKAGCKVEALCMQDNSIWHGVNTKQDLQDAKAKFTNLKNIYDPKTKT